MKTKVSKNHLKCNTRLFIGGREVSPDCFRVECALVTNTFFDVPDHEVYIKVFLNKCGNPKNDNK